VNNPTRRACRVPVRRAGTIARVIAPIDAVSGPAVLSLGHLIGSDGGTWYNFWSGLGADIGGLTLLGAAIGAYRKHNCHVHGCWRLAKQQVAGTSWLVCHRHHPEGHPTAEQVAQVHSQFLANERAAAERALRTVERPHNTD
jgi:hypothetical protein